MTKGQRAIASVVLMVLLGAGVWLTLRQPPWRTYPVFLAMLNSGQVSEVEFYGDTLTFTAAGGNRYRTDAPSNETLRERLMMDGIRVRTTQTPPWAGLAVALGLAGGIILYKRTGKRSSSGLNIGEQIPGTRFTDVAAQDEAVDSLRGLVEYIKDPGKYERFGARIPRGMLLYGPPGTGKTLLAKALAGEAGVPFFNVCGSDFVQMYVGVGAGRVRDLFKKVRAAGKAVLFIDEIDALGRRRDQHGNEEREQTLNALLTEMSGFRGDQGIVVLAATNRPDMLDEALMRPGRFDRQVEVGLPSCAQRLQILKVHARNKPLSKDVDLDKLAYNAVYFSGAKLESLLNEAAIRAARRSAESIEPEDIDYSFETVMVGEQKQDRTGISAHERTITAFHEAGHALATARLLPESKLTRLSIIPSTKGMAGYSMSVQPDKMFQTRAELEAHVAVALAGRAAEELVFGHRQITTGASNDLARATEMVTRMALEWGMDDELGLPVRRVLGQYGLNSTNEAKHVKDRLDLLYRVTMKLLDNERETLKILAERLLEEELLTEDALAGLLAA
ncbi:cell division protein FtsH [Clostridia bacterium]|nr:cell division protein FtsH [Clostridia bacterium]